MTFLAASLVMYSKYNEDLKQSVRDSTKYIQDSVEKMGESYLDKDLGKASAARITLLDSEGNVLFDSLEDPTELANHSNRPEFIQAEKEGYAETLRYSETLSKQNFYCAVKLSNGDILRVGRTTDSVFSTMVSSSALFGALLLLILVLAFILVRKQTQDLIEPINTLDLEHPLGEVRYEELRPLSGRIYHEASRLSTLVTDIIQLSRLDEKDSDMPFEPVDLYELSEDIVLHLDSAASKKNIQLQLEGASVSVEGVRQVLYEMLYNIADNAVRYTNKDGIVKIFVGQRGSHPYYRVEDNGIGIPKEEQKRIFERFYRVDKSHSRETGGTGLGLSIVKHGAILHNAEIVLDSEPGQGTKMELVF